MIKMTERVKKIINQKVEELWNDISVLGLTDEELAYIVNSFEPLKPRAWSKLLEIGSVDGIISVGSTVNDEDLEDQAWKHLSERMEDLNKKQLEKVLNAYEDSCMKAANNLYSRGVSLELMDAVEQAAERLIELGTTNENLIFIMIWFEDLRNEAGDKFLDQKPSQYELRQLAEAGYGFISDKAAIMLDK